MSESLKKVTLFCKLGSEKVLKDNVLLKEIPRAWYFTSNFVCQKLVPRENLKIFQCFAGCCCCSCSSFFFVFCFFFVCFFFFVLFFLFCFCSMWKVVCLQFRMFLLFFFPLKFLVGMSSLFRVFIHVFGVNQCGV